MKSDLEVDKELKSESHVHGAVTESSPASTHAHGQSISNVTHCSQLSSLSPFCDDDNDIFISYSREQNTRSLASQLKSDLEGVGFKVWMDVTDIASDSD